MRVPDDSMPFHPEHAANGALRSRARRGRGILHLAILTAIITGAASPLSAQIEALTRPVNLATLARRAEVIVQGRVISARPEPLPGYPNLRTVVVTLEVERMLRGPAPTRSGSSTGARFTFRQYLGGAPRRGLVKSGYAGGEQVLLFLPAESSYGLRSPLGLEQGHFLIRRGPGGQEFITNRRGNAGLFRNVPESAQRAGLKLDDDQLRLAATPKGPVPLRNFISLLEELMRLPKNE
jgi:hypothetical protein